MFLTFFRQQIVLYAMKPSNAMDYIVKRNIKLQFKNLTTVTTQLCMIHYLFIDKV